MNNRIAIICAGAVLISGCVSSRHSSVAAAQSTRRLWLTISAERGEENTIAAIYIDRHLVGNVENLAQFTSPDKPRQIGYFPLPAGDHTIEAKAEGFKPVVEKVRIIPGEEGAQNVHLHLKRSAKAPISIFVPAVESATGRVVINGVDPNRPQRAFTWNWGDGHIEEGWFPMAHTYLDTNRDFVVTLTAHYENGQGARATTRVSFQKK